MVFTFILLTILSAFNTAYSDDMEAQENYDPYLSGLMRLLSELSEDIIYANASGFRVPDLPPKDEIDKLEAEYENYMVNSSKINNETLKVKLIETYDRYLNIVKSIINDNQDKDKDILGFLDEDVRENQKQREKFENIGEKEEGNSIENDEKKYDFYLGGLIRLLDELTENIIFANASGFNVTEVPLKSEVDKLEGEYDNYLNGSPEWKREELKKILNEAYNKYLKILNSTIDNNPTKDSIILYLLKENVLTVLLDKEKLEKREKTGINEEINENEESEEVTTVIK